jgi:hypothetical protein
MNASMPPPPPRDPISTPPRGMALRGDLALKILVGSGAGIGIGFGTCGLATAVAAGHPAQSRVHSFFIGLGLIVFLVSIAGLVISGIWLLISAIVGGFRR